jgi:microcystin-dependent protein
MWSGSVNNIPSGWVLCDGRNGTPNLQNRFIVGAGNEYEVGDTGGKDYVQLSVYELPSHTHEVTMYGGDLVAAWTKNDNFFTTYDKYSSYKHNVTTSATGNNVAHENRPPFYALCFIMKK